MSPVQILRGLKLSVSKKYFRITLLQINAGNDWRKNLDCCQKLAVQSLKAHPQLIAFPENFCWRGSSRSIHQIAHEVTPFVLKQFQAFARCHRTALLLGSLLELSAERGRYYNTSFLISEKGRVVARYRKIHLFDVQIKGKVMARESRHIVPGKKIVTGDIRGVRMGLSICYDLRFPELFRRLAARGSRIIFVPSNFTETTGLVHWKVLLRARAIENQAFVIAPALVGIHPESGIRSFGTSLVVDPWGKVLKQGSRYHPQILTVELDLGFQKKLRKTFPVLAHRRLKG